MSSPEAYIYFKLYSGIYIPLNRAIEQELNKSKELPEYEKQQVMAFLQGMMARMNLDKL
ncbi:hypothetical protein [Escherichia coli]|uniref:hypothetical protein n=1 Tax=Escherichia coli TaxID=562 RepID=UPI001806701E|nr:hypothetical protein [Escherichia coli]EFG1423144.1 hypothetical protein [Escherichia coli]EIH1147017.1 hypothetical protein [Escherichia coli]MDR9378540.1 hypothetical protein [Escherichia coli]HAY0301877.1 hypothetical protein [Escherichia coli]